MIEGRFKSLAAKFILTSAIILSLVAVYLCMDYRFTHHIKGEATKVNIAGQMRFRSFEMAWLAHRIAERRYADPSNREWLIGELKHEMDVFEGIARDLKQGNAELGRRGKISGGGCKQGKVRISGEHEP
ncbi:MAG: hypothetical protein HY957_09395 [Nitrospirae bacterium]|nr:hypothetical protein [Nitrospirota bacterium]